MNNDALGGSRWYRHLAIGLANLIYIFNPQKIIIGGGLTHQGDTMLQELMAYMTKYRTLLFWKVQYCAL